MDEYGEIAGLVRQAAVDWEQDVERQPWTEEQKVYVMLAYANAVSQLARARAEKLRSPARDS